MERLERLLDEYDGIPLLLQGYIQKKIPPDFERFTQFMRDLSISITTNPVENYSSSDRSKSDKEEVQDITQAYCHISPGKMEYWTKRFGRAQHSTN